MSLRDFLARLTGWKADLIVRKGRSFSVEELRRLVQVDLLGLRVWMATAEDCVLSKLEWARAGSSERQIRDVRGILDAQASMLDLAYVERWVRELGLEEQWAEARR